MFKQLQEVPEAQYLYKIVYEDESGSTKSHYLMGYFERLTPHKIEAVGRYISGLSVFEQAQTIITEFDSVLAKATLSGRVSSQAKALGKTLLTLDSVEEDMMTMLSIGSFALHKRSQWAKLALMAIALPIGAYQVSKALAKYRLSEVRGFKAFKERNIENMLAELHSHPSFFYNWVSRRTLKWLRIGLRNPGGERLPLAHLLKSENNIFLAINIAHFYGSEGLLEALQQSGFAIQEIEAANLTTSHAPRAIAIGG